METRLPHLCFTLELGNLSLKGGALGKSQPGYGGLCAREGMPDLETPRASAPGQQGGHACSGVKQPS